MLQRGVTIISFSIFHFLYSLFDTLYLLGALSASVASFSKASFVVSGGATNDVAIDDPDFWTKVVGLAGEYGRHVLCHTCRTDTLHPVPLYPDLAPYEELFRFCHTLLSSCVATASPTHLWLHLHLCTFSVPSIPFKAFFFLSPLLRGLFFIFLSISISSLLVLVSIFYIVH
jgi:hypothetical protein